MNPLAPWVAALFLVTSPCAAAAPSSPCRLQPVPLTLTGGKIGTTKIILHDGTTLSPGGALAWDEPMQLRHPNGKTCTVSNNVSIITTPMIAAGTKYLYVTTDSGSQSILFAISVQNCHVKWQSHPFTSGPILQGNRLKLTGAPDITIAPNGLPQPNHS